MRKLRKKKKIKRMKVRYEKQDRDGKWMSTMERKHDHVLTEIDKIMAEVDGNDIIKKKLIISENAIKGSDNMPTLIFQIKSGGMVESRFKLSHKKMWGIIEKFLIYYSYDTIDNIPKTNLSNETKAMISILHSDRGIIMKSDLVRVGINPASSQRTIKGLLKRDLIREYGRVGKEKLYKCTIDKDELRKLFTGGE